MLRHLKNIGKCKKAGTINMFLPHNVSPILGVYKLYFNRERDDDVTAAASGTNRLKGGAAQNMRQCDF